MSQTQDNATSPVQEPQKAAEAAASPGIPTPAEIRESAAARERERLRWEEEERRKKLEERERLEQERIELERRRLYAELEELNYDLLALVDYPTDHEIYVAKRARNLWFVVLGSGLFLFFASLFSLASPWIGGIAGGLAFLLWLTHGSGMISYFPSLTRYTELLQKRRKLKLELIEYIRKLEGTEGYIHRIYPLVEHNPRLGIGRFKRLALYSRDRTLFQHLRSLQDVGIYHEYLQEALKGYHELLEKDKEDAFVDSLNLDSTNQPETSDSTAANPSAAEAAEPTTQQQPPAIS